MRRSLRSGLFCLFTVCFLVLFASCRQTVLPVCEDGLTVTVLDIGKADCILLELDGQAIMIDTGLSETSGEMLRLLDQKSISDLDALIISHFDKDHLGGAAALLQNISVSTVYQPDYAEDSKTYLAYLLALSQTEITPVETTENITFSFADAEITIYAPQEESYENENNYSLMVSLTYGDSRFLFAGDAKSKRLQEFLREEAGTFDFVKMPHHGSFNSSSAAFIQSVSPTYAVITNSATEGAEPELLEELQDFGTETYLTSEGTVVVCSDGDSLQVLQP
ncbi:MAG TPA: MBL fold metallo-hydrolase [Firmicutes bacterium]|nr:MBL fold metallo-hydrolase [Bacillota bacterium]